MQCCDNNSYSKVFTVHCSKNGFLLTKMFGYGTVPVKIKNAAQITWYAWVVMDEKKSLLPTIISLVNILAYVKLVD